jgi:hypothetical protein
MGAHRIGAERAVEADREGDGVAHRVPERLDRLARQGTAGEVGDRAGNHHRQADALLAKTSSQAKIAALALSVSKIVSIRMQVSAAVDQAAICSP